MTATRLSNESVLTDGPNALLAMAMQHVHFGLAIFDESYSFVYINEAGAEITGVKQEDILGKKLWDIVPEIWPIVAPSCRSVFESGRKRDLNFQAMNPAKPDEMKWFHSEYYPILDARKVIAVATTFEDITEAKQVENSNGELRDRLLTFVDNIPGNAYLKDKDGRYIYLNEEAAQTLGRDKLDVVGKSDEEILPEEIGRKFADDDDQVWKSGKPQRRINRLRRGEQEKSYLSIKFPMSKSGEDRVIGGITVDITENVRIEDELRAKTIQLQHALERFERLYSLMVRLEEAESLQSALEEILNASLELVGADAGTIRLFDPPGDALNFPFAVHRGFSERYIAHFAGVVQPLNPESRAATARGERVIIEDMRTRPSFQPHLEYVLEAGYTSVQATPLVSLGRTSLGLIATYFVNRYTPPDDEFHTLDLYARLAAAAIERHKTEQALRQALAAKDEFLGLVSHELRTPMTVIRGLAKILDRGEVLQTDELDQAYEDLARESERLYRLIENMLAFSRVQAGQKLPTRSVDVGLLLPSLAETIRVEIRAANLKLQTPVPRVAVDCIERYVEQILHNLVENSCKYSPAGSEIVISASIVGDCVEICVADDGIGLQDPEGVFKPFRREEAAEDRASGLGLGLAVCKLLVEAQGGRIRASNRDRGGSVFVFTLPRSSS